jgi:hypothetical protein
VILRGLGGSGFVGCIVKLSHYPISMGLSLRLEQGYNLRMQRAALFALLVVSVLGGSLQAQRTAGTFHGSAARSPGRSGVVGQRGSPNRFFPGRSHFRHNGAGGVFAPYFVPYDEPFDYGQPETEAVTNVPVQPVVIPQTPAPSVPKAQVIEIPVVANSAAVKLLPPTVFILANGERLETRRFLLTASNLSFSIDRQQRTISLDRLDLDATIAANHERGIDLRIPADRNEISLSF